MLIDGLKRLLGLGGGNGAHGSSGGGGGGIGGGESSDGESPEMISCADAMARLQEFVDGELHGLSHDEVEAHFEVCTRCYPHLAMEETFKARVHAALSRPTVPDSLRDRVVEMLARED